MKDIAKGHYSYDMAKSNSAKPTNQSARVSFGTGKLSGTFITDDVRLGIKDEH